MDFTFSREHEMLQNMVRQFALGKLAPEVRALNDRGQFPSEPVREAGRLGLIGMPIPREYGGSGMGHLARMISIEEVARVYPPLGFFLQTGPLAMYALYSAGSEPQKQRYLPAMCKGEMVSAFALTEPSGGSDPTNMSTEARLDGNEYIINGRKSWISLAGVADVVCVVAKAQAGPTVFAVERGTPGFDPSRREEHLGLKSIPVNELLFSDCRVPKENVVGAEGKGLGIALGTIGVIGRTGAAGIGLGIGRGCFDALLKFSKERILYGKPTAELQAVQFAIADIDIGVETAKWLCYSVTWRLDKGESARALTGDIARAKLYATDMAIEATNKAARFMGAYGISPEYQVAGFLNDALPLLQAAGSQETMKLTLARQLLS